MNKLPNILVHCPFSDGKNASQNDFVFLRYKFVQRRSSDSRKLTYFQKNLIKKLYPLLEKYNC